MTGKAKQAWEGFTQGKWRPDGEEVYAPDNTLIADCFGPDKFANAALIASATDLLRENERLRKALGVIASGSCQRMFLQGEPEACICYPCKARAALQHGEE